MSIEAVARALETPLGGNTKVILLGLANHAHPDGTEARPSFVTLARYAHCDRQTVRRHLRKLEEGGWIVQTGWHLLEGRADRQVAVWSLTGVYSDTPAKSGVSNPLERGINADANGVSPLIPEPLTEPSIEPSEKKRGREAQIEEVWGHYQAERPHGERCKLGPTQRRLIVRALDVRPVDECKLAISALMRSDYHVQNGYLDLKYALLGGGRSPTPEATIDRLTAQMHNGTNGNGNGHADDELRRHLYDGVRFDDLPRHQRQNIVESFQMGYEPWNEGAAREPGEVRTAQANGVIPAGGLL